MIRKLYKYSVRTILFFSILAVLVLSIAYSLVASEIGTRWLVSNIVSRSDNALTITEISGTLLSSLTIGHLTYTSCNASVSIDSFNSEWKLKHLFYKKIDIKHLRAKQVTVGLHKDCNQAIAPNPAIPDSVDLPVDISLHTLSIDELVSDPGLCMSVVHSDFQHNCKFFPNHLEDQQVFSLMQQLLL